MNAREIIESAAGKPLSDREADFILWERTAFPFGDKTPKELYKKANGFLRAVNNNLTLCTHCTNIKAKDSFNCNSCNRILKGIDYGRNW